ncbi:MAG: hypothetical protein FWE33_08095 [Defluviitaleaceae bacterium]|nr:hypothetical protein [Defluviitaleaceae bacterium]
MVGKKFDNACTFNIFKPEAMLPITLAGLLRALYVLLYGVGSPRNDGYPIKSS